MKKLFLLCLFSAFNNQAYVWEFTHFKDRQSTMRKDFLQSLKDLFKASIFIETGTGGGLTTERAAQVFNQVYSVEIQPNAFLVAQARLQKYPHVSLYRSDSVTGLQTILKTIDPHAKSLFFLDAHYNGVANGKSNTNTPLMQELEVIFASALEDPVIIIDDARTFRSREEQNYEFSVYHIDQVFDYPHVKEVIDYIKRARPNYHVYVYGDLIVGYSEPFEVSPLITFMTEDMMLNNTVHYEIAAALERAPKTVSVQEWEALSFIVDQKILYGPITYHVFFEMWKQVVGTIATKL